MHACDPKGGEGGGGARWRARRLSALSRRAVWGGPLFGSPLPHRPGERRLSPAPRRARGEGASARSPARRAARPRERAARGSHLVRGVRVLALRRGLLSDVGQRAHRLFVRLRVGARVGEGGGGCERDAKRWRRRAGSTRHRARDPGPPGQGCLHTRRFANHTNHAIYILILFSLGKSDREAHTNERSAEWATRPPYVQVPRPVRARSARRFASCYFPMLTFRGFVMLRPRNRRRAALLICGGRPLWAPSRRYSLEHLLELPRRDGGLHVVVAAEMLPLDEDVGHGALAGDLQERRLDLGALINLVELRKNAGAVAVTREARAYAT